MIIVKIIGGLGNQLFQYAFGRYIAQKNGTDLKIDILGFKEYKLHKYSLRHFNIQELIASQDEVAAIAGRKQNIWERAIMQVLNKPPKFPQTYIEEKHFHFDPDIMNLPDDVYLDGYWQSEKCFAGIEPVIRQEFTIKTPQTGKDKELAERMASCESVSLHIRRGDYVSNSNTNRMHGTCKLEYYYHSVEVLTQAVKSPHFFIFSDDPDWASNNLSLPYPTILVTHNGIDKNYEDLRLMSQCKHHIIANSTFSWWGAWLNPNKEKTVIAPKKWFRDKAKSTKDLIPDSWIRI